MAHGLARVGQRKRAVSLSGEDIVDTWLGFKVSVCLFNIKLVTSVTELDGGHSVVHG